MAWERIPAKRSDSICQPSELTSGGINDRPIFMCSAEGDVRAGELEGKC